MIWILILLLILIAYLLFVKKVRLDLKSFFKKGFINIKRLNISYDSCVGVL